MNRLRLASLGLAVFFFLIISSPIVTVYASVFSDGFESGDLTAWTDTSLNGATIAATQAQAHSGTWSAVTAGLQSAGEYALLKKTVASAATYYLRFYVRFVSHAGNIVALGSFHDGTNHVAYLILDKPNNKWGIYNAHKAAFYWEAGTSTINTDTWYCVEMRITRDATAGVLQLWVDGTSKVDQSSIDTGDTDIVRPHVGGLLFANEAAERIIYFDCAVVDTSYIGIEPTAYTAALTLGWTTGITSVFHWVAKTAETLGFQTGIAEAVIGAFHILGSAAWTLGLGGAYHWVADAPASLSILSTLNSGVLGTFNVATSLAWTLGISVDSVLSSITAHVADLSLGFSTSIGQATQWIAHTDHALGLLIIVDAVTVLYTASGLDAFGFIIGVVALTFAVVGLLAYRSR